MQLAKRLERQNISHKLIHKEAYLAPGQHSLGWLFFGRYRRVTVNFLLAWARRWTILDASMHKWCHGGDASFLSCHSNISHDDVIKRKHFPRYWPFVQGIHRSPVDSPHKGQRRGALMFSLICAWINGWVNNDEAGDLRRHRAHYDVSVMSRNHFTIYSI